MILSKNAQIGSPNGGRTLENLCPNCERMAQGLSPIWNPDKIYFCIQCPLNWGKDAKKETDNRNGPGDKLVSKCQDERTSQGLGYAEALYI